MTSGLIDKTYSVKMIPYSHDSRQQLLMECVTAPIVSNKRYLNIGSAFDSETSSFIDPDDYEETALLYIWMFGVGNTVVYGRTLDEFTNLIEYMNEWLTSYNVNLITYIHFAKFDFSFIKYLFHWDTVFLKENRDVLYAKYGAIEFRDSLVLSGGQSLASIGENLRRKVLKAVGDLDYSLIRHSGTPLTQQELHYCEMDIRVLEEYITEKIEDDGDISKIPYTNTGYVRNYVRNACFANRRAYAQFIAGLTMTPACYVQAESVFQGGSVFGNLAHIGETVSDVHSYDIKSSYPYVMCTGYYPINYFTPVNNGGLIDKTTFERYLRTKCCMFELELWDVEPINKFYFPISKHKCSEIIGNISDTDMKDSASGRIISALYLSMPCTELDFFTICKFYRFTEFRITNMRIANRGYLPKPIVESVIKFFNDKTTLDGVRGKEREYMIAKNMLNAVYGMMVEKPVRPVYQFWNKGLIDKTDYGFRKFDPDFVEQIVKYNEKYNRFLFYPWGVWVTAHARYRLHEAILAVGDDFVYCDTDSVKFTGNHDDFFERENRNAYKAILDCARRFNIPLEHAIPTAPDGSRKILGCWEHEYDAYNFKTLGAKRYMVEYSWTEKGNASYQPGEKYSLTTSGTDKKKTLKYIMKEAKSKGCSPFDIFSISLVVPPKYSGRTIHKYIDDERTGWITDYLGNRAYYESPSGIYIKDSTYSYSITDEMKDAVLWLTHDGHYQDGQF